MHEAQLPVPKTLAEFDWGAIPDLDRAQIEQLAHDTGWLDRAENLLLFGPSGVGKTHLAAGICRSLIALDRSARFFSATTLVQELQRAKADYALAKALNRLDRFALLVIDDIGYVRKDEAETSVLFELAPKSIQGPNDSPLQVSLNSAGTEPGRGVRIECLCPLGAGGALRLIQNSGMIPMWLFQVVVNDRRNHEKARSSVRDIELFRRELLLH